MNKFDAYNRRYKIVEIDDKLYAQVPGYGCEYCDLDGIVACWQQDCDGFIYKLIQ